MFGLFSSCSTLQYFFRNVLAVKIQRSSFNIMCLTNPLQKYYWVLQKTNIASLSALAGDVHRPGDEGHAEAPSSFLTTCGQAGDASRCRVWTALHPCHGCHRHLLHTFTQCPHQSPGEHKRSGMMEEGEPGLKFASFKLCFLPQDVGQMNKYQNVYCILFFKTTLLHISPNNQMVPLRCSKIRNSWSNTS